MRLKSLIYTLPFALLFCFQSTAFSKETKEIKEPKTDFQKGVEGKIREGKSGTVNEGSEKQLKELEKQEKSDYAPKK